MIVAPGHGLIVDQRVDDRFLDCLDGGGEDWIEQIVRHSLYGMRRLAGIGRARIV